MEALFIIATLIAGFWLTATFGFWGMMFSTMALIAFGFWNHQRNHGDPR